MNNKACSDCENNKMIDIENHIIPKSFVCKLMELPNVYVFTLETIDYRFGFFIFSIEQPDLFELYKPFINNLGNFIALSLENRLHKSNLQNAQNILENRVKERTSELQTVNKQLEEEIEVRKRTDEELQKSEERFRRLTENARDVIYRMSLTEGKYEYISQAMQSMIGFQPEEFYDNPKLFRKVIHPNWHNYFDEQWAKLLKGDMPPTYEYQIIHKSGEVRWLNQRNILIRDNAGNPIAIEGIITDITERKHAEEELQRLNEELEQRVNERTMELEKKNRDLEKMNKLFVGRELSMIDLKKKIANLEKTLNNREVT